MCRCGPVASFRRAARCRPALAHGPSRQKVVEKIEIDAPAAKVWEIVGNFQDWNWHPAIAKTEGTGGNAADAKRKLTLKNGGVIEESLTKYDADGKSLSYKIDAVDVKVLPVNNYASTISVKEDGGKSVVEWKGAFYRGFMNNDPPPELSDEAGREGGERYLQIRSRRVEGQGGEQVSAAPCAKHRSTLRRSISRGIG